MQPANIALALRQRSPWEATDLGLAMMQRWWRPVFAAHAAVMLPVVAACILIGHAFEALWIALLLVWWLEPVYDRVILHVLSRAVFGESCTVRDVLRSARTWLNTGLAAALTYDRADLARSFNLPVLQLEGQRGREARARRRLLGRRARGHAVWLTTVWVHFEAALALSAGALNELLLPAQLERARAAAEPAADGLISLLTSLTVTDVLGWAAVIFLLEPFYVAAGFGLYLNRRTLLEGWDVEVALRRIAERHAAPLLIALALGLALLIPGPTYAQERKPKAEIAEVVKAPEFGYYRDALQWLPRDPPKPRESKRAEGSVWEAIGYALARAAEVLLWGTGIAALAYALWWMSQRLPRALEARPEDYRPPAALFGMELAPDRLPPDVAAAAAALVREGKLREALSLLYRGALSDLVHKRGVQLLASHTEGEAVRLAGMPYFAVLVDAWRRCAYAQRTPSQSEVTQLANQYKAAFA